jgi:selT/selW/selH-like putative selenoprotein
LADFLAEKGFEKPRLIPSSGGAFEVKCGDVLLFSKLRVQRFPENSEILDLLKETKASR